MNPALKVEHLSFGYSKDNEAINDLSFSVPPGEVVGLIGPNGSGKSTLIRLIADLLKPRTGTIRVFDAPSTSLAAKQDSILLASNDYLPEFLTGLEYLRFIHGMYGLECRDDEVEGHFFRYHMTGRWNDLIEDYSHGMRKKIQLVAALMVERPLALIDETPNGIDVEALCTFEADIERMTSEGRSVLLCTHNLPLLERVADSIMLLSHGALTTFANTGDLVEHHGSISAFTRKVLMDHEDAERE